MTQVVAILISVISLVVALSNFYWSNVRVRHDATALVDTVGFSISGHPVTNLGTTLTYRVTLINRGNQPEAILRLAIYHDAGSGTLQSPGPGPFIVDKNAIVMQSISLDVSNTVQAVSQNGSEWSEMGLYVEMLMPDNTISKRNFKLGKMRGIVKQGESSDQLITDIDPAATKFELVNSMTIAGL